MKKPVVDYRKFRLSKINEPEFSHLKLLSGWIVYFILYIITESFIPEGSCYILHSSLDDKIPFIEYFIIPYVSWYLMIAFSLGYYALYDTESFKKLMTFLIITQISAMIIYIVFPNRQDLRPESFPRDNIFTKALAFLYKIDTDTNVCPSMHVGFSLALISVWTKDKNAYFCWKLFVVIFDIIVIFSIFFIKQHSVIDAYAAFALCFVVELVVYGKYWKNKMFKSRTNC